MTNNPYAALGATDFLSAVQRLLPRGRAWPRDPAAVQTSYWGGLGDLMARLNQASAALSEVESDPSQTTLLLPDWETAYGLPDPCTPLNPTLQQRRNALLAKIAGQGGQSRVYFHLFAAALGYAITITEFRPFRAGINKAGDPVYQEAYAAFTWQVNAPMITTIYFRTGVSAAGEPLQAASNTELECRLRAIAPAHTQIIFNYGP